jgi:Uma2 family endonuclease
MTHAVDSKRCTPAKYYELERVATSKSDYVDGWIIPIPAGTSDHSLISVNVIGELRYRLKGSPCRVLESNMRLKVEATGLRTYPDASVYCGPLQYDDEDPEKTTATNPTVLVEVLSPSTEAYDRGLKSQNYRRVKTLLAYLLVAQNRPYVELHHRQPNGDWTIREVEGLTTFMRIDAINVELPLSEIYDRVEFPQSTSPPSKSPV